ncbi:hypothetical protein NQ315_001448 [Exocentrus adspersus]|uniref:Tudor domain-containing protein n=1 Tax=Exocentrus adspersus TaxID=1586481 RepID=A0AAV8W8I1_9CUCU|nr:hypothetical protein NQ315_001448 [Exocentrus adspersus]
MDRRRVHIRKKIDEINEEKVLLQSNLEEIMGQIYSCLSFVNGANQTKMKKDCFLVLKYQLEVLKKLNDINYELECVIDESPLRQLQLENNSEDLSSVCIIRTEQEAEAETAASLHVVNAVNAITETVVEPIQGCSTDEIYSSALPDITSRFLSAEVEETESNISESNLQMIRTTLRKFSEKLGLNSECISSMTDFYQKSSDYQNRSPSHITGFISDGACLVDGISNDSFQLEVPEKDTNGMVTSEEYNFETLQCTKVETDSNKVSTEESSSVYQDACNVDSIQKLPTQMVYIADETYSTDSSIFNGVETEDNATHCHIPLVDENSVIIGRILDKGNNSNKTDDNANKPVPEQEIFTALEKLNNMNVCDRRAEAIGAMQTIQKPNIELKPTELRIKNNLEAKEKKITKKKNKKNKNPDEFYELMPKAAPNVGMDCVFCHIESPDEFYIHIVDEEVKQIDVITEQLDVELNGTVSEYTSKEEACNAIGTFCFSYVCSYKSWYRARVLDWELNSKFDDVVIQFVDYGNTRRISYKNLRKMTKEMAEIPMLAVRCHLPLLYPPNSTHANRFTDWPDITIDAMMELSGLLGRQQNESDRNSVAIDLRNLDEVNEENTVGQILLNLGFAEQIVEEYDIEHSDLELFLQDVNSLETADNINEAVMGYDPRDEARICPFTKSDGTCYKGKGCKLEHVFLSKDGFTTDKEPVFKEAMYSLELPEKGAVITILITAYKDVCNFFAHIVQKPHRENKYMIDKDLYTLLANMNMPKSVRTYETFKIRPAMGEIVIVKHWSRKWLRAVVRDETVHNDDKITYQVFTLDFGEYLTVPINDLRKIKPHFLQLPFQVIECYMHNYIAKENCDMKKAKKYFIEHMYYHNFMARTTVPHRSDSLPLKMAITTFDAADIGKRLVDEGFAKIRVSDKNPADDCGLQAH